MYVVILSFPGGPSCSNAAVFCDAIVTLSFMPCQIPRLHVNHPIHGLYAEVRPSDTVQFSIGCRVIRSHCFNFVTMFDSQPSGLIQWLQRPGLQRTPTANELLCSDAAYLASHPGRKAGTKTNTRHGKTCQAHFWRNVSLHRLTNLFLS